MITNLVWNAFAAFCLLTGTSVSARFCVLTTEPDQSLGGKVRFVLPPGDPCSCTQVVLGGHNAYAPPRPDQPVYIDYLPMDAEGLRRLQGCPDESTQINPLKQTSTSMDEASDTPVTGEAPVVFKHCQDALNQGMNTSGVYTIRENNPFEVYCEMEATGKGYIVIQKRYNGSVDFNRNWNDYKEGFGDLDGEFWLGNEKIHQITRENPEWELLINLTAFDGSVAVARYKKFLIKKENSENYKIDVSFDGDSKHGVTNADDAFETKEFSTFDEDNDGDNNDNCAQSLKGGWWFGTCADAKSNLNGLYHNTTVATDNRGIFWSTWKNGESLKTTEMKIRHHSN